VVEISRGFAEQTLSVQHRGHSVQHRGKITHHAKATYVFLIVYARGGRGTQTQLKKTHFLWGGDRALTRKIDLYGRMFVFKKFIWSDQKLKYIPNSDMGILYLVGNLP
jgi:hypothetical protein